jgi:2-oxoglutarate dehydrogenase E2 component (dihydrolipoamide succinyltransferase)
MATNVQIPPLGESVTEAVLLRWIKQEGEAVRIDEPLCELETDKANVELPSPAAGALKQIKKPGDTVKIGDIIAQVDEAGAGKPVAAAKTAAPAPTTPAPAAKTDAVIDAPLSPSVRRLVRENEVDPNALTGTGPRGRVTKEDVLSFVDKKSAPTAPAAKAPTTPVSTPVAPRPAADAAGERREPMSKIRKKIAERLVTAQHSAAMLTTFNEIDMSSVMELREKYKERFLKSHGVSLGLMSFFARAAVLALKEYPVVNAFIDNTDVVYHDYVNLGVAVSTDRGLVVPILRHVEKMSFAKVELEIKRTATAARDGKLSLDEMSGGTFTVTNGGVFGSLMSTPIINPPQSAILGLHAIQKRPIAVEDKVEIRPMMYVALSYDHRLIDGKDSVRFLVKVKESLEDPARLMLEI